MKAKILFLLSFFLLVTNSIVANDFVINGTVLKKYTGTNPSVIIPDGITHIDDFAFNSFELKVPITSVQIPNTVTHIGDGAFRGCIQLASIIIPSSVESIGFYAFQYCTFTTFNIPASVKSFHQSALMYCEQLTSITVDGANTNYSAQNGILYSKDMKTLILCPEAKTGDVVVPSSVTSIMGWAFDSCENITSIDISPNTITKIENHTFQSCRGLTSFVIPEGVQSVDVDAFSFTNIKTVTFPISLTSIDRDAFSGCETVETAIINSPALVEWGYLFRGNSNVSSSLQTVVLGEEITQLVDKAFEYITSLKTITFGSGLKSIGKEAFKYCHGLTEIVIPEGVTTIDTEAFSSCYELKRITIPASVTSIGLGAIGDCLGLEEVKVNWQTPLTVDDTRGYWNCTLKVPQGTEDLYKAKTYWKDFKIVGTTAITSADALQTTIYFDKNDMIVEQAQGCNLSIFNVMGNMIYTQTNISEHEIVNTSNWNNGVYVVILQNGNNKIVQKLLKNN